MKFELIVPPELLEKITLHGIRINGTCVDALWTAVEAAEAAQNLAEGVEPGPDEEAAQAAADEPYAVLRGWYSGESYHDLLSRIRRENRKTFGRRAKFTITPEGRLTIDALGVVHGLFLVEVRRSKRTS